MKKTYEVFMNDTGRTNDYGGVRFTVQAESEHNAIQIAQDRYPNKKVAWIKEK